MGSSSPKKDIENQMSLLKLERMEIQVEKEKALKKLSDIEGTSIKGAKIPDYIDPIFAKKNNIYTNNDDIKKNKKNSKDKKHNDKNKKSNKDKKDKKNKNIKKDKDKKEKDKNIKKKIKNSTKRNTTKIKNTTKNKKSKNYNKE